jgi:hypothetical protein
LPSEASAGEKRAFAALQQLDDECLVYYEPLVRQRYPDFVVIIPDTGVLIIEVKGWYPADILRGDHQDVRVKSRDGVETVQAHPVRQGRDYMHRLRDECREHPFSTVLLNTAGEREGAFIFPFGHIAVLSNITRGQLDDAARPLAPVFSQSNIVTRDELMGWTELDAKALKAELIKRFDPYWPIAKMTQRQIDVLRTVIHPEVQISAEAQTPGHRALPPAGLKVLDYRQERNARSIGDGHRVVYGVAGSGKTILLIARAKMLAEDPGKRVLVLCFNKVLASSLRAVLAGHRNVDVFHFHAWGARHGVRFGEDAETYGARFLDVLKRAEGDAGEYDAVLVDEAQDFACSWFRCAKQALKEPEDGDLIVVGDGSQSLYRSRPFTWKDAGVNARGRVINQKFDLDRNYRNTAEILAAAQSFAGSATADGEDVAMRSMTVSPGIALRHGPWPRIIRAASRAAETGLIITLVRHWISGGAGSLAGSSPLAPGDIGILYPRLRQSDRHTFEALCAGLAEFRAVRLSGEGATGSPTGEGIKISTIHSAKGLQFRAVILMWADLLPSDFEDRDEDSERKLLYVGLTRAEDLLVITHTHPSAYVGEIGRNIEAVAGLSLPAQATAKG